MKKHKNRYPLTEGNTQGSMRPKKQTGNRRPIRPPEGPTPNKK